MIYDEGRTIRWKEAGHANVVGLPMCIYDRPGQTPFICCSSIIYVRTVELLLNVQLEPNSTQCREVAAWIESARRRLRLVLEV